MSSEFSWADRVNIVVNACCEPCFSWVNACLPCLHPSDSFTIPTWSLCRRQPIQLPHDHNDDDTHDTTPHSHHHASTTTAAAAAPFDSVHSLALVPEEQRRSKEERRARRTEKKIARALAARASLANEFEGFQGSGQAVPLATAGAHNNVHNDESDDHADLDGIVYTRTRRSASHSDSRSRTSTSTSKKSKSSRDSTSIASPISPTFNGEQRTHIPPYTYPTIKDRTFPSTGFAVKTGTGSRDGAFLAHSGDDAFDGTF